MDKLFRFSKWFILFCALLVAARLAQQYVADKALEERAAVIGERVYGWRWQNISGDLQLNSQAKVIEAKVIKRGPNDGQVRIQGNQVVMSPDESANKSANQSVNTGDQLQGANGTKDNSGAAAKAVDNKPLESKFTAVITLYKDKDKWLLGKVEAE
ncbi:hypothetical protein BH11CYA1_BH11CYA1_18030 [soil metagenome]